MARDITVKISIKEVIGKTPFGYPLIFAGKQTQAVDYIECKKHEDVKTAGFAETTDVYKAAELLFKQKDAPAKIAVCASTDTAVTALEAIKTKEWRQLIVTSAGTEGESTAAEIAAWVEKNKKMFFTTVTETSGLTDYKDFDRTILFYYTGEGVTNPEAALVGATSGKMAGSFTYKNIILKGIEPLALSDTEIEAAHTAGCITFVTKAGDNVTTEGKVASGEYIDIIDSIDFVIETMEYRMQKLLNSVDKLGYDNNGIAQLESVAISVLQEAYTNGIIASTDDGQPNYTVSFEPRSASSEADRKSRIYNGGRFTFGLRGAIHYANINGEIEI